jgi:hypothetical protein
VDSARLRAEPLIVRRRGSPQSSGSVGALIVRALLDARLAVVALIGGMSEQASSGREPCALLIL